MTERIIIVRNGKGQKDGVVPTHPAVWLAFRAYGVQTGWLFPGPTGGPVRPQTVGDWVRELFAELGIHSSLHKTRHRFGTRLAQAARGDMRVVQAGLRHATLATSEHYVAFDQTGMSEMINLLPELPKTGS